MNTRLRSAISLTKIFETPSNFTQMCTVGAALFYVERWTYM